MRSRRRHGFSWAGLLLLLTLCGCGGSGETGSSSGNPQQGAPSNVDAACFQYNLDKLNAIRRARALPEFTRDAGLDAFAQNAVAAYAGGGAPHGYFASFNWAGLQAFGFRSQAAENQGWSTTAVNTVVAVNAVIDSLIDAMMAEETQFPPGHPDRGHFENITNAGLTRIGIGLTYQGGRAWMSNDFSGP